MSRGDLEHTEEMLYKQSRESLSGEGDFVNPGATVHHKTSWEHDDLYTGETKSSSSFSFKVFTVSALLLIFAGAFFFYSVTVSPTTVDSKKIVINLEVSPFVEGGREELLKVSLSNNNNISLLDTKIIFTYDKGGTVTGEPDIISVSKDIGEILPLAVIKQEFPYTLFGIQNEKRPLSVRLDYKIKGSNAVFPKESGTEVIVSAPPLLVTLEGPTSIVSGEQYDYTVIIKNSASTSSPPSLFVLTAPTGFSLIKSTDTQIDKSFSWAVAPLSPGEEKRFTIQGIFTGVSGEKSTLKGSIGSRKEESSLSFNELFSYDIKVLEYVRPGLSSALLLETDRGPSTTLRKGDKVTATILYKNEGLSKASYVEYLVRLPQTLDPRQIFVNQSGYYDVGTNSIIWSSDAYERFLSLGAGQDGALTFTFVVPNDFDATSLPFTVTSKGMNASLGKLVEIKKDFSYLVSGTTAFSAYTTFLDSERPNTGPIPPRVDTETTYTAIMTVSTQTDLQNASVVFSVPSLYVKYLDGIGASSTVSYDSKNKLVTWNIGVISKEVPATVKIKLAVKPSLIHLGASPNISSKIVLNAENTVTKEKVQQIRDALTTQIKDGGSNFYAGVVVK
jgi:hypothetical protein